MRTDTLLNLLLFAAIVGLPPTAALVKRISWHRFVKWIGRVWQVEKRAIQLTPVRAAYYGNTPRQNYSVPAPTHGAIGLVDDTIRFESQGQAPNVTIPFSAIRWMGNHPIPVSYGKTKANEIALVIHYQETYPGSIIRRWRVAAFITPQNHLILSTLAQLTGLQYTKLVMARLDYGPIMAVQVEQDIYGQWHEKQRMDLYIAPDNRLLVDLRGDPLPLDRLTRIEVIAQGATLISRPLRNKHLLRFEYRDDHDQPHTRAFLTRYAAGFARTLSERSGVPYTTIDQRKKKAT